MIDRKISRPQADTIYDILVEVCGAVETARGEFVDYVTQDIDRHEYRFSGSLGFGGKFYNNSGRWYVSCYSEDETRERLEVIAKANEILEDLKLTLPRRGY